MFPNKTRIISLLVASVKEMELLQQKILEDVDAKPDI